MECGHTTTQAISIDEGYALPHTLKKMNVSGREVSQHLKSLLECHFEKLVWEDYLVDLIKKQVCRVDTKEGNCDSQLFELPDGSSIEIESAIAHCTEILFENPNETISGVHELISESIGSYKKRDEMYGSIVISGGSTMFPGFKERITRELEYLSNAPKVQKIYDAPERTYISWIGGSILVSLSLHYDICISRHEYDESGPNAILRKCF